MWIETTVEIDRFADMECEAEIDYEIDGGELVSWKILDFRVPHYRTDYKDGAYVAVRTGQYTYCPDSLRPALQEFADKDKIEDELIDRLILCGEMYGPSDEDMRSDYHARLL